MGKLEPSNFSRKKRRRREEEKEKDAEEDHGMIS
jgi:hypothetical protein